MWLERTLGRVTCARAGKDAAAHESRISRSWDRVFKGSLAGDRIPADLPHQLGAKILGNGTLPDATSSSQSLPSRSAQPSMPFSFSDDSLPSRMAVCGPAAASPVSPRTKTGENIRRVESLRIDSLIPLTGKSSQRGILAPGVAATATSDAEMDSAADSSQKEMRPKHE